MTDAIPCRILLLPNGNILARVTRLLALAGELASPGHEVLFAGDGKYMSLALSQGYPVYPLITLTEEDLRQVSEQSGVRYYTEESLGEAVREERELFERLKPDILISDFRISVSLSSRIAGLFHATLINSTSTSYAAGPLDAPDTFPLLELVLKATDTAPGFIGRPLLAAVRSIARIVMPPVKGLMLRRANRPFNRLCRLHGLKGTRDLHETWADADCVIVPDLPAYSGLKPSTPERFHMVGPLVWEFPTRCTGGWADIRSRLRPDRKTVYVTMGSMGAREYLYEAIAFFGSLRDIQCILSTAGIIDPPSEVPENVFLADFVPGREAMELCDAVICQGGNGTIYQAIQAGIPIIGIPVIHDQIWNMSSVERLGIGVSIGHVLYTREKLREALETVMTRRDQYVSRIERLRERGEGLDGSRKAAQIILKRYQEFLRN